MASSQLKKIAVFPASGNLGTSVYETLVQLFPAQQIVLIARHPEKIPEHIVKAGAEVREGDFDSPESLDGVFDGISYLLMISYPTDEVEHRVQVHTAAIDYVKKSKPGIEHLFYTAIAYAGLDDTKSAAFVMQAHLQTEALLQQISSSGGFSFTSIREGLYSETYPMYTAFFDPKDPVDEVRIPHDGSAPGIAWAAIADLGEASAKLVKDFYDGNHIEDYLNKVVVLSGPEVLTLAESVQILAKYAGKSVTVREVPFEEHATNPKVVKSLEGQGEGDQPREWSSVFQAIRDGEANIVTGHLERLLGRPAERFEATVKRMMQE